MRRLISISVNYMLGKRIPVRRKKYLATIPGSLLVVETSTHRIRRLYPSIQPWTQKPKGPVTLSLSLLCCFIKLFHHMFIFNLHCQLVLRTFR